MCKRCFSLFMCAIILINLVGCKPTDGKFTISNKDYEAFVKERDNELVDFIKTLPKEVNQSTENTRVRRNVSYETFSEEGKPEEMIQFLTLYAVTKGYVGEGEISMNFAIYEPIKGNKPFEINDHPMVVNFIKMATRDEKHDLDKINVMASESMQTKSYVKNTIKFKGYPDMTEKIKVTKYEETYLIDYRLENNGWKIVD